MSPADDLQNTPIAHGAGVALAPMGPPIATGLYQHYKGGRYEVLGLVRHSESLQEMGDRVYAACDDLLEAARHHDVVVVSHATPIKAAMAWALGVAVTLTWRSRIDQASITRILIRDRGPALHAFNIVPALRDRG